jgi:hypothetical protein
MMASIFRVAAWLSCSLLLTYQNAETRHCGSDRVRERLRDGKGH